MKILILLFLITKVYSRCKGRLTYEPFNYLFRNHFFIHFFLSVVILLEINHSANEIHHFWTPIRTRSKSLVKVSFWKSHKKVKKSRWKSSNKKVKEVKKKSKSQNQNCLVHLFWCDLPFESETYIGVHELKLILPTQIYS